MKSKLYNINYYSIPNYTKKSSLYTFFQNKDTKSINDILYKESINVFYPYDVVLKPSSGKWITRYVLRIRQTNYRQNIFDFENTEIVGKTSTAKAIVNKVIKS